MEVGGVVITCGVGGAELVLMMVAAAGPVALSCSKSSLTDFAWVSKGCLCRLCISLALDTFLERSDIVRNVLSSSSVKLAAEAEAAAAALGLVESTMA